MSCLRKKSICGAKFPAIQAAAETESPAATLAAAVAASVFAGLLLYNGQAI